MTLKRKFFLRNAALLALMLTLAGASLWGLWGLKRQVDLALYEYSNLRIIESAEAAATAARGAIVADPPDFRHAADQIRDVQRFSRAFGVDYSGNNLTNLYDRQMQMSESVSSRCDDPFEKLTTDSPASLTPAARAQIVGQIESMFSDLHQIASDCHDFVANAQSAATDRLSTTMWTMACLSVGAIVAGLLVSISQYRLVLVPLNRLRQGVRSVAAKNFSQRVESRGDAEFVELAGDFNRMAVELEELYRDLEAKVAAKSKELVRSERLASVGFLAAGVAHEINNPLNIISGYAELSLKHLLNSDDNDPHSVAEAANGLRVIRDESFRCKEITEKLLSLAKTGTRDKEPFSMTQLAEEVTNMIRGLQTYRDRRVVLGINKDEPLTVFGNANEIKQVLLNLTVNALEATVPQKGEVSVAAKRVADWVELEVCDNGRGIAADLIDHVFEPFFTAKRGAGEPGTGLGLSISHAIIESHGGQVRASSDGPGRGSRFIVRLPAVMKA